VSGARLPDLIGSIRPFDTADANPARQHVDRLTKPQGSLGRLEDLAVRLAVIQGGTPHVESPVLFTFAADHGVAAEGVSAYPQTVTAQMVENFARGGAAINVLARAAGARLIVADFGVRVPATPSDSVLDRRRGDGTANIARGPAMSRADAVQAIEDGAGLLFAAMEDGADFAGIGEMGIANTTSASALTAALTGRDAAEVTGRGTGIDAAGLERKTAVVRAALRVNAPDPRDALDVLAKVGGFEIAGLAGVVLAAASRRVPVAVDGFIAGTAALVAAALAPGVPDVLFASHRSPEPGHAILLARLGLVPYLDLGLRLGEGTGAALFIHLARAAARLYTDMATFKSAGVDGPRDA
jgi:nicotinate-nucleotide--dimethylbenzimidazole phosphoribosyltransferase